MPKISNRKRKVQQPVKKKGNPAVTMTRSLRYRLPSDQFHIALKYSGTVNIAISSFATSQFGLSSPGALIPKYWNEFFGIYKYCYVEAVSFKFQITETANRPLRIVIAESNTDDITPTSYLELAETPRSVQRQVISGGNHSVVNINLTTKGKAVMGHQIEDDNEYWNTASTGPSAFIQPLLVLGYEPIIPLSTCSMTYQVEVVYHLKYFTLNHK